MIRACSYRSVAGLALALLGMPAGGVAAQQPSSASERNPSPAPAPPIDKQSHFDRASKAFDDGDYATAEMLYRELVAAEPANETFRYNLARTFEGQGQMIAASAMMANLAPEDKQGLPIAHLWQALQLLRKPAVGDPALRLAEAHLLRASTGTGKVASDAHAFLGQMYLSYGRLKDAEEHFSIASEDRPELKMALARVYVLDRKKDEGRRVAEDAVEFFCKQMDADQENKEARMSYAEGLTFLERFGEAVPALERGRAMWPDDARFAVALGRVYLTWEESLRRTPNATAEQHRLLLIRSLEADPQSRVLHRRLIRGIDADEAIVAEVIRAEPNADAMRTVTRILQAIETLRRGDRLLAVIQLKRTSDADELAPRILAGMGAALVDSPPQQVERARELVGLGIEAWPGDDDLVTLREKLPNAPVR